MFRHNHRASKDIDVFVLTPEYLGYLTPRLSDKAADMTSNDVEDPSAFVKLQFEEGKIDFVAEPNLLEDAWEWWEIVGQKIRVETSAGIIVKECTTEANSRQREISLICAWSLNASLMGY